MIRVVLVEDHSSFRQALAFMISREPDMEVIGQAGTVVEGIPLVIQADVAVVDLDLEDGNGVEIIQAMRQSNAQGLALVLTASSNPAQEARAAEAGAAGIMHKSARVEEVIDSIRLLHAGENLLPPERLRELLRFATRAREQDREAQALINRLTPRELEVLQALAEGLTDKEIARRLVVSNETSRKHMVNILSKLEVNSRLQALVFAIRHGVINLN